MEFCELLHTATFPPARLPWIPVTKSDRKLVNFHYAYILETLKNTTPSNCNNFPVPQTRYAALLTQKMNSATIPYYLPKRYIIHINHKSGVAKIE
jgi:hypothetical protein